METLGQLFSLKHLVTLMLTDAYKKRSWSRRCKICCLAMQCQTRKLNKLFPFSYPQSHSISLSLYLFHTISLFVFLMPSLSHAISFSCHLFLIPSPSQSMSVSFSYSISIPLIIPCVLPTSTLYLLVDMSLYLFFMLSFLIPYLNSSLSNSLFRGWEP